MRRFLASATMIVVWVIGTAATAWSALTLFDLIDDTLDIGEE